MLHTRSLADIQLDHSWLTIGTFDGVHRGHQSIIKRLVSGAHAEGKPAVVVTFDPHPAIVLGKRLEPLLLTTPDEKAGLLGEMGVDVVVSHPFNPDVANLSAFDFIARLKNHLGFERLIIGYDFALGRQREGDRHRLFEISDEIGYELEVLEPFTNNDTVVSSSDIRKALREGKLAKANNLLGRWYQLPGTVIPGDGRGRTIGVPTANLEVPAMRLVPQTGVYVCRATLEGEDHGAVTNIGIRPTFMTEQSATVVETHLLDYSGELYGKVIVLSFIDRLRDERRFDDSTALFHQIQTDILTARNILRNPES